VISAKLPVSGPKLTSPDAGQGRRIMTEISRKIRVVAVVALRPLRPRRAGDPNGMNARSPRPALRDRSQREPFHHSMLWPWDTNALLLTLDPKKLILFPIAESLSVTKQRR